MMTAVCNHLPNWKTNNSNSKRNAIRIEVMYESSYLPFKITAHCHLLSKTHLILKDITKHTTMQLMRFGITIRTKQNVKH